MAFQIIAEKESETVRMHRDSSLIAVAKARIWADEGWTVTVVVADDEASIANDELGPALIPARPIPAITFEPN
jgi:hypothetical protein